MYEILMKSPDIKEITERESCNLWQDMAQVSEMSQLRPSNNETHSLTILSWSRETFDTDENATEA